MPFIPFDKKKTKGDYIKVEQGSTESSLFNPDDGASELLSTEGLNPCIGIVLQGQVVVKEEDGTSIKNFAVLNHHPGLSDAKQKSFKETHAIEKKENILTDFWFSELQEIMGHIEEGVQSLYQKEDVIEKITLTHSFVVRCTQIEDLESADQQITAQTANQTSTALKTALSNRENLVKIGNDYLTAAFFVAADYQMACMEIPEVQNPEGFANTLNCYVMTNDHGELEVMCHDDPAKPLKEQKGKAPSEEKQLKKQKAEKPAEPAASKKAKTKKRQEPAISLAALLEPSPVPSHSLAPKKATKSKIKISKKSKKKQKSSSMLTPRAQKK